MAQSHPFDLTGRVALVTGAHTGIGQGIAVALAQAGADIAAVDVVPLDETKGLVEAAGRRFHAMKADLTSIAPVQGLVEEAVGAFGGLDILVNNAGLIRRADAVDFTEADWDLVMNINIKTVFFLCQAFGRYAIAQGRKGKIINIASMLSFQGGIRVPSYTASKSGVAGLTRLLANEWAAKGINVNAIAPSITLTERIRPHWDKRSQSSQAEEIERTPLRRVAEAADQANVICFLASSDADFVTGLTIDVTGGV